MLVGYQREICGRQLISLIPDFTVHIYNAQFVGRPGIRPIEQGDVIAKRLNCEGQQIDSVFMEIRFRGRHVNVTDMILGTKCQKPEM